MKRLLKHLLAGRWQTLRYFPPSTMRAIESAIQDSESTHMGELRFAVEAGLDWPDVIRGKTAHERALEVFSQLRIWDTEHNSGVLIYLLLADRQRDYCGSRYQPSRRKNRVGGHLPRDGNRLQGGSV